MKTIEEMWKELEATVLPASAPPIQRVEMRRAFYSGAISVITELAGSKAKCSDEMSLLMLQYSLQVVEFTGDIERGVA